MLFELALFMHFTNADRWMFSGIEKSGKQIFCRWSQD